MAKPDFQLKWGVNRSGGIPATDPADYQLGWQYRSGLPPLTGNFDYYQNLADERLLYLNAQGIAEWDALTAYDANAYVKGSDGELYRSTAPTTGNDPTAGAPWTSAQGSDSLNTGRQDVVSAATTILPTDTSQLNITGTATITSFTVPVDRCYFVRFDAACTLVNSASLVTQRGADIECEAGDTCWMRSTAGNVVEVGSYTRAQGSMGDGQAWQDLTASRSDGVVYTNTTGSAISVAFSIKNPGSLGVTTGVIQVDGATVFDFGTSGYAGAVIRIGYFLVVPNGSTYAVQSVSGMDIDFWSELRS